MAFHAYLSHLLLTHCHSNHVQIFLYNFEQLKMMNFANIATEGSDVHLFNLFAYCLGLTLFHLFRNMNNSLKPSFHINLIDKPSFLEKHVLQPSQTGSLSKRDMEMKNQTPQLVEFRLINENNDNQYQILYYKVSQSFNEPLTFLSFLTKKSQ